VKLVRAALLRLVGSFRSRRSERDLSAELESHLQLHIDDNLRAGMTPEQARRAALIALGGVEQTKERYRDRRGLPMLESMVRDLRYGVRTLMKDRGFTAAGVLILGLGIGVNSAIFTVVNAVVLRPLPFAGADRIVRLWHTPPPTLFAGSPSFPLSPANFVDWEEQNQVFDRMAIYRGVRQILTGSGEPDAVIAVRASADFLPILGLSPTIGRGFTRDDDRAGGPRTALLSNAFFASRFGGDASIIGQTILLNRVPHVVIGVVPDAPVFINRAQIYVPLAWTPAERAVRSNHNYLAIAKLTPGVDVARAQADLTAIADRLALEYPEDNTGWGALVLPLQDDMIGNVRSSLMLLLGAVALVLLIACANVANLMLVRTHGRAKEIALRGALGAGRLRIVQQLLAEGLVLGVAGGVVGFAAAYYAVDVLKVTFGTALPRVGEVVVDTRVLTFTAIVALATGLVSAFAPAWQLTGRDANDALKTGPGRGSTSGGDGRVRHLLVASEVALALMLLVGAGLLMRSLSGLRAIDPGFDASNVLTATVDVPDAKYSTPEQRNQFFERALQNVRALPGVESAAWVDTLPLQGGSTQYVVVDGMPPMKESEMPVVAVRLTSPGYFHTARIQMRAGRDFTEADGFGQPAVVIVSENTAKRFWPGDNPLGKRLTLTMMTKDVAEVVGVVREVKTGSLDASETDSETAIYAPAAQFAYGGSTLTVRTRIDPRDLTRSVIAAIQRVDPEQPVLDIATLDEVVEESLGPRPLAMMLLAVFAALALVLASVGIYSVLAYTVRQRVREIGIRIALGAPVGGVLRLVVVEGLKPTLVGVALGLVLAAALVRVMTTLLYGVSQYDPRTFGAVALIMLAVGMVATLVPAYRAARVDPIVTLRAE
jgi:predicted permease